MPGETRPANGAAELLAILRDGRVRTRAELVAMTGLARSTVSQRLNALVSQRWIVPAEEAIASGGRPATAFAFNGAGRVVIAADLGATHARVAVADLAANILGEVSADLLIDQGAEPVLSWLVETAQRLLAESGHGAGDVCTVGVGLPGPVEHASGRPINPPIMPGWDGFDVPGWLGARFGCPVLVDNDVNIMARGEHWAVCPGDSHLIFVKVGTGIGCGVISDGRLHRGAQGAAGDIGHIRVASSADMPCRCGNTGCLEAVAGGASVARNLREHGVDARHGRDVVRLVRAGNTQAVRLVRQAGRDIGSVLASIVNFFNPSAIIIGGDIADAGELVLAGIREAIYSRSLPLATQHLRIGAAKLGDRAGVIGAAVMAIDHALAPEVIERSLAG